MNCNYKILEIRNKKYIIWTSGIINDRVFVHINGATEDNINDYISVVLDNLGIITMNGPHTLFEDGLSYIQNHRDELYTMATTTKPGSQIFHETRLGKTKFIKRRPVLPPWWIKLDDK